MYTPFDHTILKFNDAKLFYENIKDLSTEELNANNILGVKLKLEEFLEKDISDDVRSNRFTYLDECAILEIGDAKSLYMYFQRNKLKNKELLKLCWELDKFIEIADFYNNFFLKNKD